MRRFLAVFILIVATIFSGISYGLYTIRISSDMYIQAMTQKKMTAKWVVLLHGLLRTPGSMRRIERSLEKQGYHVLNFGYNSRKMSIRSAAHQLDLMIRKNIPEDSKSISFVTHSLGSLIVRYYLSFNHVRKLGRFVMIAPPNHGSIWGRKLTKVLPVIRTILGIAGDEVQNSPDSRLPDPPPCEFGIISGGFSNGIGLNPFIPGDDDFTLAVTETILDGMNDHIIIPGQHSTLLFQKRVIDNVISFLGTGKFIY